MSEYEYPYPITSDTPMGKLIDRIGDSLASKGQQLCWFRSGRSTNRANVTVNAGIFPLGIRTSVHGKDCIHHLVSWDWTPHVGKTERSAQYKDLNYEWGNYISE